MQTVFTGKDSQVEWSKDYTHTPLGDITKVRTSDLPDFELLVGGFPCQAFSIAGKRRGFDDTRGTLFFEIARILKDKRPKYFLLENVKDLLSHNKGQTFKTMLGVLSDLGYDVKWEVLNSKNFVPQSRERIYIKGYFRGECGGEVLSPSGTSGEADTKMSAIVSPTRNGKLVSVNGINGTLTATDRYGVYDGYRVRRLTPVECERLQGFPDGWTEFGADGEPISNTQRYKCLGNAVTTNVITHIFNNWDLI